MGFDEAVALLGLTPPFTAKDVRRAYLRLLKVHKPESDPEGFMRLRQAYELFEGVERVGPPQAQPEPGDVAAEPLADESSARDEPDTAATVPEVTAELEPPAPEVDEAALPPWERAVPDDAKVAAALLTEWLERAKSDPTAPPPPMTSALRVLWSMLDRRAFKTAGQLYRAIDDRLEQVGGAWGQLAWGMTQGLWEMRKSVPEHLYSPMVQAVATENPSRAAEALEAFAADRPRGAAELQNELSQRAPQLAAVFNRFLAAEEPTPKIPKRSIAGSVWWVVPLLLGVLRVCRSTTETSAPGYQPNPIVVAEREERIAVIDAAKKLTTAAEANGWVLMGANGRAIQADMQTNDCADAHRRIAECYPLLVSASEAEKAAFRPLIEATHAAITARCGPARKTVDDLLPAPPMK